MSLNPPQAYRKTEYTHRIGLDADKPAATDVLVGTLYFSTDTLILERSNGISWDSYSPAGGGNNGVGLIGPPGLDGINGEDNFIILPSISRFDTIISNTDTGAINDWNPGLIGSTLIEWLGVSDATITGLVGGIRGQIVTIKNTGSNIAYFAHNSGSSSAGNKFKNYATSSSTPISVSGNITYQYDGTDWQIIGHEQGEWIIPVYIAGDYTANGAMIWTVDSGDVFDFRSKLDGTTLFVAWALAFTTVGGTPSSELRFKIPGGFTAAGYFTVNHQYYDNGGGALVGQAHVLAAGATVITLYKLGFGASFWSLSSNATTSYGSMPIQVQ